MVDPRSCDPASAAIPSLCKVLLADQPLTRDGFPMVETELRSVAITRVNCCKTQKVVFDAQGHFVFAS